MTRLVRPDAVLVQAVIAGALSFAHLHDLAEAAGQDGWKAWAYPVSVDLLLVAAWHRLRTLRDAGEPSRSAWSWFAVALTASLGANVATARPSRPRRRPGLATDPRRRMARARLPRRHASGPPAYAAQRAGPRA